MRRLGAAGASVVLLAIACGVPDGTDAPPVVAGLIVAVEPMQGAVTRYHLDSGASVDVDFNTTIPVLVTTPEPDTHDLLIAGRGPQGNWVMELGSGGRVGDVCFQVDRPAFDQPEAVDFLVQPTGNFSSQSPFTVRLRKAPSFSSLRGQEPRSDGWYVRGTVFCLNGRAEVTGQLPR
jgi:hypothetical protein